MDPNAPFLIVAVLIGVFLLIWSSVRSSGPTAEQVALGQHKNKKKIIPNMMEKCMYYPHDYACCYRFSRFFIQPPMALDPTLRGALFFSHGAGLLTSVCLCPFF
jgi:hypothetical protein